MIQVLHLLCRVDDIRLTIQIGLISPKSETENMIRRIRSLARMRTVMWETISLRQSLQSVIAYCSSNSLAKPDSSDPRIKAFQHSIRLSQATAPLRWELRQSGTPIEERRPRIGCRSKPRNRAAPLARLSFQG